MNNILDDFAYFEVHIEKGGEISFIRIVLKICRITGFVNSKFPRFCIDWFWCGLDHRCVGHSRKG